METIRKRRNDSLIPEETREELYDKLDQAEQEKRFLSEKELNDAVKSIRRTIRDEEIRLRQTFKFLKHQNLLGLSLFLVSFIMILTVAHLYLKGVLHWTLAIPLIALPGSILHELEHDLIHNLYFKSKQWVQHIMFFVIWWVKMSIPPWYRKQIHLRHHQTSGSPADIEERLIGCGLPMRALRWLLTFNPTASAIIFEDLAEDNPDFNQFMVTAISIPTVITFAVILHLYVCYVRVMIGLTFTSYDPATWLPLWAWPWVRDLCVIMVLPNILRQFCLNLVASYCHYYGDVPVGSVYYQNQVIDHWSLWPLQLFSFNFGATHIIHHYIPNQPFYLRQMLAPKAIQELVACGVRRNDFGVVLRNNRFYGQQYDVPYKFPFANGQSVEAH